MDLAFAASRMNLLTEVRWDRCLSSETGLTAYGWILRDDGRCDFCLLYVTPDQQVGFTTSSAKLSREFSTRLFGDADGHTDCQRVEQVFGGLVANVCHLASQSADGQAGAAAEAREGDG